MDQIKSFAKKINHNKPGERTDTLMTSEPYSEAIDELRARIKQSAPEMLPLFTKEEDLLIEKARRLGEVAEREEWPLHTTTKAALQLAIGALSQDPQYQELEREESLALTHKVLELVHDDLSGHGVGVMMAVKVAISLLAGFEDEELEARVFPRSDS